MWIDRFGHFTKRQNLNMDISNTMETNNPPSIAKQIFNKVPEVTIYFWVIKVLCTTVGETASDFLNVNLNLGLKGTSIISGILLLIVLVIQIKSQKYRAWIYWAAVVLISVFGTLVTDNLTDGLKVPLEFSTVLFTILLVATFAVWYIKEKTLSIHSIFTRKREIFYWLAVLFTFALGTASGDLMAEKLGLGYGLTGIIVCITIAIFAIAWRLRLNAILSFWLIYIMTRPLGASLGDYLSQSKTHGGLGLGATITSEIFLSAIVLTVIYLALSKKDITAAEVLKEEMEEETEQTPKSVFIQVAATAIILILVSVGGYYWRQHVLNSDQSVDTSNSTTSSSTASSSSVHLSKLGDLSVFKTITQDMLNFVNAGNMSGATKRADDLEYEWDNAQAHLKSRDTAKWTEIDGYIDKVLREVRAVNPNQQSSKTALETLLSGLNN